MAAPKITNAFEWPGQPPENCPLPLGDLHPHLIHGSLGPPESSSETACQSVQPFFAQLTMLCRTVHCQWGGKPPKLSLPITFQCAAVVSRKFAPSPWGSGPPSNTWYLGPTRVIIPNGISIGSGVFVWIPNAMLYSALSMGRKTPQLPFPLAFHHPARGEPSHGHRQHAQKSW